MSDEKTPDDPPTTAPPIDASAMAPPPSPCPVWDKLKAERAQGADSPIMAAAYKDASAMVSIAQCELLEQLGFAMQGLVQTTALSMKAMGMVVGDGVVALEGVAQSTERNSDVLEALWLERQCVQRGITDEEKAALSELRQELNKKLTSIRVRQAGKECGCPSDGPGCPAGDVPSPASLRAETWANKNITPILGAIEADPTPEILAALAPKRPPEGRVGALACGVVTAILSSIGQDDLPEAKLVGHEGQVTPGGVAICIHFDVTLPGEKPERINGELFFNWPADEGASDA